MINETAEFEAYTGKVKYAAGSKRDSTYLGRFTYGMLTDFEGLNRVITIIARGYMWEDIQNPNIDKAKEALCAWCSIPDKKKATPKDEWQFDTDFSYLNDAFPGLVDKNGKESDDSERQIQRYIRLTYLIPELLEMVDQSKIAFSPAVEISYLEHSEQLVLLDAINLNDCTPSHAQSIRLKKLSQEGMLDRDGIYEIMSEEKPNQQEQIKLKKDDFRKYFPSSYSDEQIKKDILKGLELLKRQRERNREAR